MKSVLFSQGFTVNSITFWLPKFEVNINHTKFKLDHIKKTVSFSNSYNNKSTYNTCNNPQPH